MANSAGFEFELQDMGGKGYDALMAARYELIKNARDRDELFNVCSCAPDDVLQYDLDIDVESAMAHGLDKSIVDNSIAAYWGSTYIKDFSDRGRTKGYICRRMRLFVYQRKTSTSIACVMQEEK